MDIDVIEDTDRVARRAAAWSEYCSLRDMAEQQAPFGGPAYHALCMGRDKAYDAYRVL